MLGATDLSTATASGVSPSSVPLPVIVTRRGKSAPMADVPKARTRARQDEFFMTSVLDRDGGKLRAPRLVGPGAQPVGRGLIHRDDGRRRTRSAAAARDRDGPPRRAPRTGRSLRRP